METNIRRAEKKDCARLLELITELAVYEKAPNEVTVTLAHFEESGLRKPSMVGLCSRSERTC